MYTVIGAVRSRTLRVLWALEELGLSYDFNPAAPHAPDVLAHNASGKIPVLLTEDAVLTDSVAIVQFLADRHGGLTHPAGTLARARQDGMTQFACDEVDGPLWWAAKHSFVLPEAERVAGIKDAARAEFARAMRVLETRLGDEEFCAGPQLTVPDIILGQCALWAARAKFNVPGGTLGAYFARLHARPAFQRALGAGQAASA